MILRPSPQALAYFLAHPLLHCCVAASRLFCADYFASLIYLRQLRWEEAAAKELGDRTDVYGLSEEGDDGPIARGGAAAMGEEAAGSLSIDECFNLFSTEEQLSPEVWAIIAREAPTLSFSNAARFPSCLSSTHARTASTRASFMKLQHLTLISPLSHFLSLLQNAHGSPTGLFYLLVPRVY